MSIDGSQHYNSNGPNTLLGVQKEQKKRSLDSFTEQPQKKIKLFSDPREKTNFPLRLHRIVSDKRIDSIQWDKGNRVVINDKDSFIKSVLPLLSYSPDKTIKYLSFRKQLSLYDFKFDDEAKFRGLVIFSHDQFIQNDEELAKSIDRTHVVRKGRGSKPTPQANKQSTTFTTNAPPIQGHFSTLLHDIVSENNDSIQWSDNGRYVRISDESGFIKKVLLRLNVGTYFNFIDNLYSHGFGFADDYVKSNVIFYHDGFRKGLPDEAENITELPLQAQLRHSSRTHASNLDSLPHASETENARGNLKIPDEIEFFEDSLFTI